MVLRSDLDVAGTELARELACRARVKALAPRSYESAQAFRELAELVAGVVWVVRPDGRLLYGNRSWHSLTDLPDGGEFPGVFLASIHPDDQQRWLDTWQHAHLCARPYEIERRVCSLADRVYSSQVERGRPVRDHDGSIVEWVIVAAAQDEAGRIIEGLGRSLKQKDEALMAVAHEMRGPLAPIANAVKALELRGNDPACVASARSVIHRQVTQLARLVDDLLDLGSFRLACPELHKVPIDLRNVLHAAIEVAQPTIAARGHELMVCTPSGEAIVQGDEGRLTQVIVNLLVNAAKFTERGGHIRVLLESSASDHRVHIRDTGIGISHDMLSHIFDPFVQAAHRVPSSGGVGLGLALAQQLTRLHDGSLSVRSDGLGKGSEFVLQLPASG